MERKRYELLDSIRGLTLISMMVYHGCWNLVYLYGRNWKWYKSQGAYLWQQSICWTFILLSGFCFVLGKRHIKSGLTVFGSGVLVTLVTLVFMPKNRVVFGVLTCIGSCMLLTAFLKKGLEKIPEIFGCVGSFLLFLFTKNINAGYLGVGEIEILQIPENFYKNLWSTFWGFPAADFYSTDYFSVFPWVFLFFMGFYLALIVKKRGGFEKKIMTVKLPLFSFLGRHSLLIYLLHQPVIYGLQELFL